MAEPVPRRPLARPAAAGQLDLLPPPVGSRTVPAVPVVPAVAATAGTAAGARELWLAAYLPGLAFEALQDEFASTGPRAVLEGTERSLQVLLVDEAARCLGIRPGLSLVAALALSTELETRVREPARERAWLERAAELAFRYSSRVSLEPPDGLLLEIRGSVRLFGGLEALCRGFEAECRASRLHPVCAVAPSPLAALAGARAGRALRVTSLGRLAGALAPLPLAALRWDEDTLGRLASIGVRTLGEVLRLPRAGFARRFGAPRLALLDELAGRRAAVRRGFQPAERFRGRCEPDYELESLEAVLAALEPLLTDLEHFLETRQRGVTLLRCHLRHRDRPPTSCLLRLARPEARAARFADLLRERLGTLTLPAPVRRCELRTGALLARPLANRVLWGAGERGGEGASEEGFALIEQLRARLGRDGVYALGLHADHRPECMVHPLEPPTGGAAAASAALAAAALPWSATRRPLWLLAAPQALRERHGLPVHDGALELVRGPERIESGWWDGTDIERDYYVACDARRAWLWIFRERAAPHRWFLHGFFG